MANEQTLLAWTRTALALLAGALAVVHLVPTSPVDATPSLLAPVLAFAELAVSVLPVARWRSVEQAMRMRRPMPRPLALGPVSVDVAGRRRARRVALADRTRL